MAQGYWENLIAGKSTRRWALSRAGSGGLALAAAAALACRGGGGGDQPAAKSSSPAAGGPSAAASSGLVPAGLKPDQIRAMSKEDLRERFHGKQHKNLPGWKDGPKRGGTVVVAAVPGGNGDTPPSWDPTGPAGANLASYRLGHDQLVEWDVHELMPNPHFPKLRGELAVAMPEQPDPLTYVFKLQPGVKFQDIAPVSGRALTATDVKFSLEALAKAPGQGATYADVASIEVVDPATLRIKMKQPASYFLEAIASNENWIFAPEQAEREGLAKRPIGTGPFMLDFGEPGRGFKWKRNPTYWKTDPWTKQPLPYLDGIEGRPLGDPEAIRAAFVSGQIDIISPPLQRPEDMAQLVETKPDTVFFAYQPWSAFQPHIGLRLDQAPWNDERVRRALSLAIDRDAIIKSVLGGLGEYGYGLSYAWFGREFSWKKEELQPWIKFDPAEAKRLMAAAGFPNGIGRTVELLFSGAPPVYLDTYTLVIDAWKRNLGLDARLNITPDAPTFFRSFYGKTYNDMAGSGFGLGFTDVEPDTFVYTASHSKSKANYYFINDPELDNLAEQQRRTLDRAEREKQILRWKDRDLSLVTRLYTVGPYFMFPRSPKYYGPVGNTVGGNPSGWGAHITRNHWKLA